MFIVVVWFCRCKGMDCSCKRCFQRALRMIAAVAADICSGRCECFPRPLRTGEVRPFSRRGTSFHPLCPYLSPCLLRSLSRATPFPLYTETHFSAGFRGHNAFSRMVPATVVRMASPFSPPRWSDTYRYAPATSKQLEDDLRAYPMIVRCHRAFLVNLGQVEQIISHSGSMRLVVRHCQKAIPVSRSNMPKIKEILNNI